MIGHRLNHRLVVHRAAYAADGAGGRTATDAQVGHVWGQVSQPSAEERMAAQQRGAELAYVIHVLVDADVRRGDALDLGSGRRVRVRSVVQNSRATYRRLECEVVQGDG